MHDFAAWQDESWNSIVAKGLANIAAPRVEAPQEEPAKKVKPIRTKRPRRKWAIFETSPAWFSIRAQVFDQYGRVCMKCKSVQNTQCDHIKPKSKYPALALDFDNLQVLCWACNKQKGTLDETDYRS